MRAWRRTGVDSCMGLAYRRPGRRLDPLFALLARIRRRPYGELYGCGLLHGHAGLCVWFTPGSYLKLAPPVLHPLDPLPDPGAGMPGCPGCGRAVLSIERGEPLWMDRGETWAIGYDRPEPGRSLEQLVVFGPCGCEFRQFLPGA